MLRFRPPGPIAVPGAVADLLAVGQMIDDAMRPGHFFAAPELRLTWIAARAETIAWEIFRGRLLDAAQTRLQKTLLSWHLIQEDATEPMISVKLDVHERNIHVTRGLLSYVWEAFDAGGGVIESREVVKWTRELVGTIVLAEYADLEGVRDELICLIWQAVVGTSRLPLTSVEAPLPAFVFGQLHYVYRTDAAETPMTKWEELVSVGTGPAVAWQEMVKVVEFILRLDATDDVTVALRIVDLQIRLEQNSGLPFTVVWREMFNSVSLSPHTSFVFSALKLIDFGPARENEIDFHSQLLRQLCRHLTAYDLVTFHHRGANYPDALLVEEVLGRLTTSVVLYPETFLGDEPKARMRRRALRQGCLIQRHYEGHLVPDLPTSPGENARVMPESHPRVPDEQLTQPHRRKRKLFTETPLPQLLTPIARQVLEQSVRDLEHLDERVEMGLGLFIDRPLGYGKDVGEPDLTPMLAHEAFSPSLARRRWQELKTLCAELAIPCDPTLDGLFENGPWPAGLPHTELVECRRPTAALADVRKVADDFTILRTKPIGLMRMLGYFELIQRLRGSYRLAFLDAGQSPRLCVQAFNESQQPRLFLFDEQLRRRVEMLVDTSQGYRTRAGVELPKPGLRVVTVWEDTDNSAVLHSRRAER